MSIPLSHSELLLKSENRVPVTVWRQLPDQISTNILILLLRKILVQIEIVYYNKLSRTTHRTVRSYCTEYNSTARHKPTPISEKDYWD